MALGMVLIGVVTWDFPGPPIGKVVLFVGVPVALIVASRLWVGFGPDGLSIPGVLGRKRIPAEQVQSVSVAQRQVGTLPPTPSLVPQLHMADGSVRELKVLTEYLFVPGARKGFERGMREVAGTLGKPLVM
ncbi:hypothetical protein GCM10009858_09320 [Terrabacter carboxydivorans]|uniref:Uncharacterized protein n=2 Tax=Terrabacter carboxydivorans TaxID=619730 RepID=A0ABN3L0V8_9MICO